jgi:hypothetical protein
VEGITGATRVLVTLTTDAVAWDVLQDHVQHECEQLKLALAEATVQLRIWQKGSEFVDAVHSPTSRL